MTTIMEIRDNRCKNDKDVIEGVQLPGGFQMREYPRLTVDLGASTTQVTYTTTSEEYIRAAASLNIAPAIRTRARTLVARYFLGNSGMKGIATCYHIRAVPDMNLIMPPFISNKNEVLNMRRDRIKGEPIITDESIRLMESRDVFWALFPTKRNEIYRNRYHIFLYDNAGNNMEQARRDIIDKVARKDPTLLPDIWDDVVHAAFPNRKDNPWPISYMGSIADIRQRIESLHSTNTIDNRAYAIMKATLDRISDIVIQDYLSENTAIGTPDNMLEATKYSNYSVPAFYPISRYLGFQKAIEAITMSLDSAFFRDNEIRYNMTKYPSYHEYPGEFPWMHFRQRIIQEAESHRVRTGGDVFESQFEGMDITFNFDPQINEGMLLKRGVGPLFYVGVDIDPSYYLRPNPNNLYSRFSKGTVNITVALPSFAGMGIALWNSSQGEIRLIKDLMVLDKRFEEKGVYSVRVKTKKEKSKYGKRVLKVERRLEYTHPPLVREAMERVYAPEFAEAEGRNLPGGEHLPRKPDKNAVKIYDRLVAEYIDQLKTRNLRLRDMTDEEIANQMTDREYNRIDEQAKKEYFLKLVDRWVRNIQLYYSEAINIYTDILRVYVAGIPAVNSTMTQDWRKSFAYENLLTAYEYAYRIGKE